MTFDSIETERLRLHPFTVGMIDGLLAGDRTSLEAAAGGRFPDPLVAPPLMDDALPYIRDRMVEDPATWPAWYGVERVTGLVVCAGGAGFGVDEGGVAFLGYSCYPAFEGRGFATEFAAALVRWAQAQPGLRAIEATIPAWNVGSVRVAEKLGMSAAGTVQDDEVGEVLVYRLDVPVPA